MSRLACAVNGVAVLRDRAVVLHDESGAVVGEHALEKAADAISRFGDEWLVLAPKQRHLFRIGTDAPSPFAAGKTPITAMAVGRDDTVAVARGEVVELWSRDDARRWLAKGVAATLQLVVGRDHVVAVGEDGAVYFFDRDRGEALGALRLASPEAVSSYRLVHVDGVVVVLALGEWLVWIDASTRKTVRRVRARAKVLDVAADADHVVVAVEDGYVQAFRAKTGEPRASIESEGVTEIALGPSHVFTKHADTVRANARQAIDTTVRAASPITCIATRGSLAAVGERSGRVRVFDIGPSEPREIGTVASGDGVAGLFVAKDQNVVVASARVVMSGTWSSDSSITGVRKMPAPPPRPISLKTPPTAFTADDAYAFVGTQNGGVEVHDLASGRPITTYALSSDDRITALLRLAGASLVVGTGALDGRVLVVDIAEAKVLHRISPHDEAFGVTSLATDARGRLVASGSDEGAIALLDPVKGRVLAKLRVAETPVSLAFEPSGRRLAAVFADGTAAVVTFTPKGASTLDLGLRGVTQVAWGHSLVFGFKDGRVESGDRHARPSEPPRSGGAREAARPTRRAGSE